jgi:hypothetical protein
MDDAAAYYINLKNTGVWKMEISCNSQIIVLTTQLTELKTEIGKLSASKGTPKLDEGKPTGGPVMSVFKLWRLEKVDNKVEHNMIERDGKTGTCAISTSITTKVLSPMACMSLTNRMGMTIGLPGGIKAGKMVLQLQP